MRTFLPRTEDEEREEAVWGSSRSRSRGALLLRRQRCFTICGCCCTEEEEEEEEMEEEEMSAEISHGRIFLPNHRGGGVDGRWCRNGVRGRRVEVTLCLAAFGF